MLRKSSKNSPLEKKGLAKQKKKRAQQGHTEKIALEQKKGAKKKNQGERPFFSTEKKGALESIMPRRDQVLINKKRVYS